MLEGTLESFTLPDIFQLLAFTKKTGCLRLEHDASTGEVYFREGQVYFAVASTGRLALGKRLVGAGLVATDQLAEALERQKDGATEGKALRLGQILVEQGALAADELETFVREQIQDAVFDLMRWSAGTFAFDTDSDSAVIEEPTELSVSVENLIMEGSRRLEEWDTVRKKIPSLDAVAAMAPLPGDSGVEVSLKPEEWRLLTLVDGRRTVRELVEAFGQGEFATCRVLFGLVGAGLLEVRDVELDGPPSVAAMLAQQQLIREVEGGEPLTPPAPPPPVEPPAAVETELPDEPSDPGTDVPDDGSQEAPDEGSEDDPEEVPAAPEPEAGATDDDLGDDFDLTDLDVEAAVVEEAEPSAPAAPAADARPSAKMSTPKKAGKPSERLGTDPSIDADLVRRLIEGVRGL